MNFLFTLQENAFLPFEATTLFTFILNFYNFGKTFDFTHIQVDNDFKEEMAAF